MSLTAQEKNININNNKYAHEKKEYLAKKISTIKKKEDFVVIYNILTKDDFFSKTKLMENSNGIFMHFHKLSDETYIQIEQEFKKQKEKKKQALKISLNSTILSANSDSLQLSSETPNFNILDNNNNNNKEETEEETNNNTKQVSYVSPKLRYSNRERNIIKRRKYDKCLTEVSNLNTTQSQVSSIIQTTPVVSTPIVAAITTSTSTSTSSSTSSVAPKPKAKVKPNINVL